MKDKVTVGILTYNHEKFIEKCLISVLELEYENLEIIISDDGSKDKTIEIINKIVAESPKNLSIVVNQNKQNIGLAANFNKVFLELATGDYLIGLGGDDIFSNYNIKENLFYFKLDDKIMMVDFNANVIDENDNIKGVAAKLDFDHKIFDLKDYLSLNNIITFAPGRIFKKELMLNFLPISKHCPTEDSVLVVRSLLLGKICRVNKINVLYRRHSENVSSQKNLRSMSNIRIVAQYIKDAINLYDLKILSDDELVMLLKRFDYEYKRREIIYSGLNKYVKIFKRKIIKQAYNIKK